jgi:hypothetical protein
MARVLRPGETDDGSFDLEFWRAVGAEGRFAAGALSRREGVKGWERVGVRAPR